MKRIFIAGMVWMTGASLFCALHTATLRGRREAEVKRDVLTDEIQRLAREEAQWSDLAERVRELKNGLSAQSSLRAQMPPREFIPGGSARLTGEQSEQLLARLGFNWNSTGAYVVVSKETLHQISLRGLKGAELTAVACQVLATTPEERGAVESAARRLTSGYTAWVAAHAQRQEPGGDVVAKYTIPIDREFSRNLADAFISDITAALGDERASLLADYCSSWLDDFGVNSGGSTTLTVRRYSSGESSRLRTDLQDANGSNMSMDVSPYQFPEAFRPLFPGGWPELARREGFELPKEFKPQGP